MIDYFIDNRQAEAKILCVEKILICGLCMDIGGSTTIKQIKKSKHLLCRLRPKWDLIEKTLV